MRKLRFVSGAFALAAVLVVSSCGVKPTVAQGVTETVVKIGNAATTSGGFALVGVPFNAGLKARIAHENKTKVDGRTIDFVTYDDGGLAAQGAQMVEKLVEDDEVFAIVGHFGTWTVGQTLPYLRDKGVPMVYAATGINQLYFEESVGNPIFAVQPIYRTEGRILVARALKEADLFGSVDKLGVIYTTEDAGYSIKVGVDDQLKAMGKTGIATYQAVAPAGDYAAAATALKNAGVKAIIVATNQSYFPGIVNAISGIDLKVPVLTSYVSAATGYIPQAAVANGVDVYTNAWVDLTSEAGIAGAVAYNEQIEAALAEEVIDATEYAYATNPALSAFAIAGYIAADVFITGLKRVADAKEVLNWDNYVAALEKEAVSFPMGGPVDFTNGKRHGLDQLSLLKATIDGDNYALTVARPLESLTTIMAK
ncbi:MAG TPA: ABC transporter substrate-binding protein [Bacilli bacterium]|nr:ABC transporter substrate-binding protein [Bacilli bacterium]